MLASSGRKLCSMTSSILPNCLPYAACMANPACFRNASSAVALNRLGGTLFSRREHHAQACGSPCGCFATSTCVYAA